MTRAEPITLFDCMQVVQVEAIRRRDTYRILVENGSRRRDPRDERDILCLLKTAEELEKLYYERGGRV